MSVGQKVFHPQKPTVFVEHVYPGLLSVSLFWPIAKITQRSKQAGRHGVGTRGQNEDQWLVGRPSSLEGPSVLTLASHPNKGRHSVCTKNYKKHVVLMLLSHGTAARPTAGHPVFSKLNPGGSRKLLPRLAAITCEASTTHVLFLGCARSTTRNNFLYLNTMKYQIDDLVLWM